MTPVMNDTKWEELRQAMLHLGEKAPQWRSKDIQTKFITAWDGEWYYHFNSQPYKFMEYVDLKVEEKERKVLILELLKNIAPEIAELDFGLRAYGYK